MDARLEGHRRYLATMREVCAAHPIVHSHQLAALDRAIEVAGQATDTESYRASGDLFELTRAAWLDRSANHARVAAAVGDSWGAEAAAVDYAEAVAATGHTDWEERVAAGSARAAALRRRSTSASHAFTSLLLSLLRLHSSGSDLERADLREQAKAAHRGLREADPAFVWEDGPARPLYRLRTPWTGAALGVVAEWIGELASAGDAVPAEAGDPLAAIRLGEERWRKQLETRAPGPPIAEGPTLDRLLAAYGELAASVTGDDPGSSATRAAADALVAAGSEEPTAEDALARFVADGLFAALAGAPLRARAEEGIERQSLWPDPLVEHHWRTLLADVGRARTETEVELVSAHSATCFAIEAAWNVVFLGTLLAPLRAACTYGWEGGEESRAGVARSAAMTHALLGAGPRDLLAVPRVADVVARVLVPLVGDDSALSGAFEGEAGFELLREAQAWSLAAGAHGGADGMRDALGGLFDRADVAEPERLRLPISLWGVEFEVEDSNGALARPRRPPIPGMEPVSVSGSRL